MRKIKINEIDEGIVCLKIMLQKLNESKRLQLNGHLRLELITNEETIQFSDCHNRVAFEIARNHSDFKIRLIDWGSNIEYRISTDIDNERANELMEFCIDLANDGSLQMMKDSIARLFNEK